MGTRRDNLNIESARGEIVGCRLYTCLPAHASCIMIHDPSEMSSSLVQVRLFRLSDHVFQDFILDSCQLHTALSREKTGLWSNQSSVTYSDQAYCPFHLSFLFWIVRRLVSRPCPVAWQSSLLAHLWMKMGARAQTLLFVLASPLPRRPNRERRGSFL